MREFGTRRTYLGEAYGVIPFGEQVIGRDPFTLQGEPISREIIGMAAGTTFDSDDEAAGFLELYLSGSQLPGQSDESFDSEQKATKQGNLADIDLYVLSYWFLPPGELGVEIGVYVDGDLYGTLSAPPTGAMRISREQFTQASAGHPPKKLDETVLGLLATRAEPLILEMLKGSES